MEIRLPSGSKIGEGHPVFIVAEVGSNFRDRTDVMTSISQAKAVGASAVKFQLYTHRALYGFDGDIKGQLDQAWLTAMREKADAVGIELMVSAFSPEQVAAVDSVVNIHKVASAECTHQRMLEKLRAIGKPVILSTGAHGQPDICMALDVLAGRNTQTPAANPLPVVLMYCVAAYPAREIDLYQIGKFASEFRLPVGYSDHSTDVETIPSVAASHGACVIEKHVSFIEAETPDAPHSLTGDEFKRMVYAVKNHKYPRILNNAYADLAIKGPTKSERPMILRHNRRLIAVKAIRSGDMLVEGENFDICRSLEDDTHAFSPFLVDRVNGQPAKRDIAAGKGIGPGDV